MVMMMMMQVVQNEDGVRIGWLTGEGGGVRSWAVGLKNTSEKNGRCYGDVGRQPD